MASATFLASASERDPGRATDSGPSVEATSASDVGRTQRWSVWAAALTVLVLVLEVAPSGLRLAEQVRRLNVLDARLAEADGARAAIHRIGERRARLERGAQIGHLALDRGGHPTAVAGAASEGNLGVLLAVIRQAVERSGGRLERVAPGERSEDDAVQQQTVEVRVTGGGHDIGRLLSELELRSGPVRVQSLAVTGRPSEPIVTATVAVVFVERRP